MIDLQQECEYLAEHLLGWKRGEQKEWWVPVGKQGGILHHPNELLTGNGMLEIIEAMRKLRWNWEAQSERDGSVWFVFFIGSNYYGPLNIHEKNCLTLPEAVIQAAYSALKEGK